MYLFCSPAAPLIHNTVYFNVVVGRLIIQAKRTFLDSNPAELPQSTGDGASSSPTPNLFHFYGQFLRENRASQLSFNLYVVYICVISISPVMCMCACVLTYCNGPIIVAIVISNNNIGAVEFLWPTSRSFVPHPSLTRPLPAAHVCSSDYIREHGRPPLPLCSCFQSMVSPNRSHCAAGHGGGRTAVRAPCPPVAQAGRWWWCDWRTGWTLVVRRTTYSFLYFN